MTEQQGQSQDQGQQVQSQSQGQGSSNQQVQQRGKIELDPEQYDALLDRLDELEGQVQGQGQGKGKGGIDEIIDEAHGRKGGGQGQQGQLTLEDIDRMRPSQLVQLILGEVHGSLGQPIMVKLEEMRLQQEIKEIRKEHKDFDNYKEDIYKIASRNPNLSLEDAFLMAKAKRPPKEGDNREGEGGNEARGGGSRRDVLRNLPKRVPLGERPGASQGASRAGEPETRMDAAAQALEEMRKAGKI